MPAKVLIDCRDQADAWIGTRQPRPISRGGAIAIVLLWIAAGAALWNWLAPPRL